MTGPIPPTILIANSSGVVVGEHTVASTVAPQIANLRTFASLSRGNWAALAGSLALLAFLVTLEFYDDEEVLKAKSNWTKASKFLVNDEGSLAQEFSAWIDATLPEDVWSASDREAFDAFAKNFRAEFAAIATALDINVDELERLRGLFNDMVSFLVTSTVPVLILAIASIAMQFFPLTAPYATMVGIAATAVSISAISYCALNLATGLAGVVDTMARNSTEAGFVKDSRPGNVNPDAPDPELKDIAINWPKDDAYYKAPQT